jgi:hypothetical protein
MEYDDIIKTFTPATAREIAEKKYDEIAITGGEPLLALPKINDLIMECEHTGHKPLFYLYTNGIALDEKTAELLRSWGVDGINYSDHELAFPWLREYRMAEINRDIIPIRLFVQDTNRRLDTLKSFCCEQGIKLRIWHMDECYDMEPEDRYVLKR